MPQTNFFQEIYPSGCPTWIRCNEKYAIYLRILKKIKNTKNLRLKDVEEQLRAYGFV